VIQIRCGNDRGLSVAGFRQERINCLGGNELRQAQPNHHCLCLDHIVIQAKPETRKYNDPLSPNMILLDLVTRSNHVE
jgi:hypothetical protein